MKRNEIRILISLVLAALFALPAQAEEAVPPDPGDSAGSVDAPLVFDAKGVARPAASYEMAADNRPAPKASTTRIRIRVRNRLTIAYHPRTPCM